MRRPELPGLPTEAPTNKPRPPTEAKEVIGRSPTILQDDFAIASHSKTTHIGPRCPAEALQLDDRPAIAKVEAKIQRQNMLTVSFGPEDSTT